MAGQSAAVARGDVHQQQPLPPQQPASAIGSSGRADRSMRGRASPGFVAWMIALIIPAVTAWDGGHGDLGQADRLEAVTELRIDRAPAMQPA